MNEPNQNPDSKNETVFDRGFIARQLVALGLSEPLAKSISPQVAAGFDERGRAVITEEKLRRLARQAMAKLI